MLTGSCLCGAVRFEVDRAVGPFELCHCPRCRRASGSAFVAGLGVNAADFRLTAGEDRIRSYEAPVRERPPGYRTSWCDGCGCPVPNPPPDADWFEIPAGLLEGEPIPSPDRHIFVECKSGWFAITDDLPQVTKQELIALRMGRGDRPQEER